MLFLRDVLRLSLSQGGSGQATRLGVVPGVVPWRRGCEQPAFSDCATGEELADECWFAVRPSSSLSRCLFASTDLHSSRQRTLAYCARLPRRCKTPCCPTILTALRPLVCRPGPITSAHALQEVIQAATSAGQRIEAVATNGAGPQAAQPPPVLVFIHDYATTFEQAVRRTSQMKVLPLSLFCRAQVP